jgi:RNA polymerase sigma-70 factor (ECF subfamily)
MTDALLPYLTEAGDLPPYRDVAAKLELTEGAVKVAVHRLRQRFGTILRREIAETVSRPDDVDDEMRELIRAVSA